MLDTQALDRQSGLENGYKVARARETGVFDSFLQPTDRGFPMAATTDVGAVVARLLVEGWDGRRIVEIGSRFTPADIAAAMAEMLDKRVEARAIPRDQWATVLEHMGLSPDMASNWEQMQDGFNSGWIDVGRPGTETVPGTTSPAQVFAGPAKREHPEAAHAVDGRATT